MVEIIKRGTLPDEKTYETECRHCRTFFRFERREAHFVTDQREGDAVTIACPVCTTLVWVKA